MALQGSSRSRHFNFRFQPDFSIIEAVLGAFAPMDACPLLITSIVAVKPEDQGTFFQDFLGLYGYLCSVPEMVRTIMKPSGLRYWRWGGEGRLALETGFCRSHEKRSKNAATPTSRVLALLGDGDLTSEPP